MKPLKILAVLVLACSLLLLAACASQQKISQTVEKVEVKNTSTTASAGKAIAVDETKAAKLVLDTKRRHLGDSRMPESRSKEWATVREPESTFFETEFDLPAGVKSAVLKVNTFGSEWELNPVYLNGKQVGGLCVAFDKDGWKLCEIKLKPEDLASKNKLKIDTYGSDHDDIMIEGVYLYSES